MKLGRNVHAIPRLLNRVLRYKGLAFARCVYLRCDIYEDLLSKSPKPESVGILIHEQTHVKRAQKLGWGELEFSWRYWFDANYRFREEIAANKAQFKYLKEHGGNFDLKKRARQLSGFPYLWCVSYGDAIRVLKNAWRNA
jgi:hypothetical protein